MTPPRVTVRAAPRTEPYGRNARPLVQLGDRLFFLGSRGHPGHASTKTPEMRGLFPRVPNIGKSLFAGLLMADLQTADLCHDRHQAPAEPSIGTPDEADMV